MINIIKKNKLLKKIAEAVLIKSINTAVKEQGLEQIKRDLNKIVSDLSTHRIHSVIEGEFAETKARGQHAFQMGLLIKAVRMLGKKQLTIVDIGDSAGTHLEYIKALCHDLDIDTISVDIDKEAVDKIKSKGMKAIHSPAEELDLGDTKIDIFTSFEMVEHLTNPSLFFRRMAVKGKCELMLITVPYLKNSRVGLHHVRSILKGKSTVEAMRQIYPEQEHVFELSPDDWKMLISFSGWRIIDDQIYRQYPQKHIMHLMKPIWKKYDFEGFWGAILRRDRSISDLYRGWSD